MAPIKEVELDRVYEAPVDAVWSAWTDPTKLREWWGPDNVIITDCQVEVRVGGRFFIVMEAGKEMGAYAGTRWPMEATFTAVEPKARLAYTAIAWTEGQKDETQIDQTTEVIFTSEGAKTRVRVRAAIHRLGPKAGMAAEGMRYGFTQQQEKLALYLGQKSS
jgi:uncharacterized protein YndB with AHSA1/START domain